MKENITELKTKLKSQNRIKLFSSPNNHHFLYDAFSQNIYPINEFYAKYLFSEYDVLPDDQNVEKAIVRVHSFQPRLSPVKIATNQFK